VSERDHNRGAELRAERVRWRERSRDATQASRSMNERLRKMSEQGSNLDKRLRRHADDSERWHTAWDDPAMREG
jgi:predicted nuclease with TOPRIM domain